MPIGYGSNIPLAKLSSAEVGIGLSKTSTNSWLRWLSVLTTVAEIGLNFIPGVGTAISTGIALSNAGIQTGIEYAETGKVSGLSAGLNFGASIIPGASEGLKSLAERGIATALRGGAKVGEDLTGSFLGQLSKDYKALSEGISGRLTSLTERANAKVGMNIKDDAIKNFILKNSRGSSKLGESLTNRFNQVQKIRDKITALSGAKRVTKREFTDLLKSAGKQGYGGSAMRASKSFGAAKYFTQSSRGIGEFAGDATADANSKIFRDISDATGLFKTEINALRNLVKDGLITDIKKFTSILENAFKRSGNEFIGAMLVGTRQQKFMKLLLKSETSTQKISRISSKGFAWTTKVGGYVTSPSSLAADAISKTVAKITTRLEKYGEEFAEKFGKYFKKGAQGLHKLEKEFERTGGNLLASRWIMGYKVLQNEDLYVTILIQFKNSHPNVVVRLTPSKLKAWLESKSKGSFYINNFARSRGGRKVSELGISGKLENLLGYLPIAKINEIIGFAGFSKGFIQSVRANKGALIWHTGDYIKGFKQGIIQGIINEGVKGAVAFGTRNQYAKQVFEGGINSMIGGQSFSQSFSNSFNTGATSLRDTSFEDRTTAGGIVKQIKPIQAGGTSVKGLFGG